MAPGDGFAFFDVDDTLISLKSVLSFQDYWYAAHDDAPGLARFQGELEELTRADTPWEIVHRRLSADFAGRAVAEVETSARAWFEHVERTQPMVFHPAVVARLGAHRALGVEPVFVSGSFPPLLAPIAQRLEVRHVLATRLVIAQGRYTGDILAPQPIGTGKAEAITAFLAEMGTLSQTCHGYADDISDVPMLRAVGHPTAIAGGRGLEAYAATAGWPILNPY